MNNKLINSLKIDIPPLLGHSNNPGEGPLNFMHWVWCDYLFLMFIAGSLKGKHIPLQLFDRNREHTHLESVFGMIS